MAKVINFNEFKAKKQAKLITHSIPTIDDIISEEMIIQQTLAAITVFELYEALLEYHGVDHNKMGLYD